MSLLIIECCMNVIFKFEKTTAILFFSLKDNCYSFFCAQKYFLVTETFFLCLKDFFCVLNIFFALEKILHFSATVVMPTSTYNRSIGKTLFWPLNLCIYYNKVMPTSTYSGTTILLSVPSKASSSNSNNPCRDTSNKQRVAFISLPPDSFSKRVNTSISSLLTKSVYTIFIEGLIYKMDW